MKANLKTAIVLIALVVVFAVIGRQLFKLMNLSAKDFPPFKYVNDSQKVKRYFDWLVPMAQTVGQHYGIPWQAIAVQTALETGWGKSSLLTKYNNFGGIKAAAGDNSVPLATQEFINGKYITITDGFAVWKTPYEGLIGYANFFHRYSRYKAALNYPNDPYKFIEEIKKAGYATAPNYVATLHQMLNKYFPKS